MLRSPNIRLLTVVHRYFLKTLNIALHGVHLGLIAFSLLGWMFCQTRLLNLIALGLILFSWYGLGPLLGKAHAWGYCLITDIQWKVRRELGLNSRRGGYMKYLADNLFGGDFDESRIDKWSVAVILACFLLSLTSYLWLGSCPPPSVE